VVQIRIPIHGQAFQQILAIIQQMLQ